MKKSIDRFFILVLIAGVGVILYAMSRQGFTEAVSIEMQRYSGVNKSHIYLGGILALGSFPVGWMMGKLRTHN